MNNFDRTAAWLKACGKTPGDPADLTVQIGCHIEEFLEFLDCLAIGDPNTQSVLSMGRTDLAWVAKKLMSRDTVAIIPPTYREAALDALCDAEVTGNGVAYLAGFHKSEADAAVLDSNDAKLVDGKPVLKQGGKIAKPEGWKPPNLRMFV